MQFEDFITEILEELVKETSEDGKDYVKDEALAHAAGIVTRLEKKYKGVFVDRESYERVKMEKELLSIYKSESNLSELKFWTPLITAFPKENGYYTCLVYDEWENAHILLPRTYFNRGCFELQKGQKVVGWKRENTEGKIK